MLAKMEQKLKNQELKFQQTDKKSLVTGSIIATLIAITPFLYNLYESVPDVESWDTFFGTYKAGFYESVFVTAWTLMGKLIPIYLLFIWFFTCRHWWYHAIIVPIAMYVYQIISVISEDKGFIDSNQLIYLVPIMAVVIPSIYLIRAKIFNEINTVSKSMEELEDEFKISPKNFWDRIKQYF